MPAIVRPRQQVLFSDRPRGQVQADLLDAQIANLVAAIHSTQLALDDIRRDDGKLRNNIVGREQLQADIKHSRQEIDSVEARTHDAAGHAITAAGQVVHALRDIDLRARDAEAAAVAAAQMLSAISHGNVAARDATDDAENSADRAESAAIQSQNSANYSVAQADNAIAAKDEALQWAEYLAGPVVSNANAPDFIEASKFPTGLFYQPVVGMGGLGGLWSAKWWAVYCQQLVGNVGWYYLGPSDVPMVPGGTNPNTGATIPNPLAVGSFYYDTTTNQIMIWNGTSWQTPGVQVSAGYEANYRYLATAGQTVFGGPDVDSQVPVITDEDSSVFLNGVRLVPNVDFTVDISLDQMTLVESAPAGAVVQWDLLVPPDRIGSKKLDAFKVQPLIPDGVKVSFTLTYIDPSSGNPTPAQVGTGAQLQVCLDGIVQEPAVDYTATASTLTMTTAPRADSHFWAIWYAPYDVTLP